MKPQRVLAPCLMAVVLSCAGQRPDPPAPDRVRPLPAFDPGALQPGAPPGLGPLPPVAVVDHGPQGRTQGEGTIHVRFNQPMQPLELSGIAPGRDLLRLSPATAGKVYFQSPDTLVFEPKAKLAEATDYTVEVRCPIEAVSGQRFTGPLSWHFQTERPRVSQVFPTDKSVDQPLGTRVLVQFDQPTTLAQVQAHVSARARPLSPSAAFSLVPVRVAAATKAERQAHEMEDAPSAGPRTFALSPATPAGLWPVASEVVVEVSAGLRGRNGPLPLDVPFRAAFHTYEPLRLVSASCGAGHECGLEPITLRFNNRIRAGQQLDKLIRISPRPGELNIDVASEWTDTEGEAEGGREVTLSGIFLPGTTYAVQLSAGLADVFAQRLGKEVTHTAIIAHRPTLELSRRFGTLPAERPQTIGLLTHEVQAVQVRLAALDGREQLDMQYLPPRWQVQQELRLSPAGPTAWSSVVLDLAKLSGQARRAILVEVHATALVAGAKGPLPKAVRGLFRITDLGPLYHLSGPSSLATVIRLSTGRPVAGAAVTVLWPGKAPLSLGRTDAAGLLSLPGIAQWPNGEQEPLLVVSDPARDDHAYVLPGPAGSPWEGEAKPGLRPGERLIARLVTERDAYLPGETVRVVGFSAVDSPYVRSGLRRLPAGMAVKFTLVDGQERVVRSASGTTTEEGKFWAELPLPAEGGLGHYHVTATLAAGDATAYVRVADYRPPSFAVTAAPLRADLLSGEAARVRASASYFFGGPVHLTAAHYSQSCSPASYRPPGLDREWVVGEDGTWSESGTGRVPIKVAGNLKAEQQGLLEFVAPRPTPAPGRPIQCHVSADLQDRSFQGVGAETGYLIHPARHYLALLPPREPPLAGDTVPVKLRALGWDGTRVSVHGVTIAVERSFQDTVYKVVNGQKLVDHYVQRSEPLRSCLLDASAGADASCPVLVAKEGRYKVLARTADGPHQAHTTAEFFVLPRPKQEGVVFSSQRPASLEIAVSRKLVVPGDPLEVTVRGPWPGAAGVLVLSRNGLRDRHPFTLDRDGRARFLFTADDTWTPGVFLQATAVTAATGPGKLPQVHEAAEQVGQDSGHRRLQVQVQAPAQAGPGERVPISVVVRDAAGRPSQGRVALWAVDEAVLSLTHYEVPDLLPSFVPKHPSLVRLLHGYDALLAPYVREAEDPWLIGGGLQTFGSGAGFGTVGRGAGGLAGSSALRSRFLTTPLFLADLPVGPDGQVRTTVALPDDLTTFRISAVASARLLDGESPGRFGLGETRLRVTRPFLLRAALPRLLRPGDAAEIAALVSNLSGPAGQVQVMVHVKDGPGVAALVLAGPDTATVPIEEGGQVRVPFQVRAQGPGHPEIELSARLVPAAAGVAALQDALRLPVPVEAERTQIEHVATYGSLADEAPVAIPVRLPKGALPAQGGITVTAGSSLLAGVADAARALVTYPYGCIEQTSSRLLPVVALARLAQAHPFEIDNVPQFMSAGVERILSMQLPSGGFAYWPGGTEVHPYASAYATWVLQLALQAGYPVPRQALDRALGYLMELVEPKVPPAGGPDEATNYFDGVRQAIALHALGEAGRHAPQALGRLFQQREGLPLFARAFLLLALHRESPADPRVATLTTELLGSLAELPATAHATERLRYSLDEMFFSDGRSDAILLMALLRVRPDHAVVVKLARGLLEGRTGGAWRNTQENAYALLALAAYARVYEREVPDLSARAWVGSRPILSARFAGSESPERSATLPMAEVLGSAVVPLVLQRLGHGRLYYRLGVDWASGEQDPQPSEHGIEIERVVRAAGQGGAVAAGEPVAFDLSVRNRALLHYVVLDVPIPAGLEPIQNELGQGQHAAALGGTRGYWVSHEEQRKDRVVVFSDALQPGTHHHTLQLRATTPGRYTLPPAVAGAMYMPEVYGRSAGAAVVVR